MCVCSTPRGMTPCCCRACCWRCRRNRCRSLNSRCCTWSVRSSISAARPTAKFLSPALTCPCPAARTARWRTGCFPRPSSPFTTARWCGPMSSGPCHRWLCSKSTWCCATACLRTSCALTPPRLRPGASALACWASFNSRCCRCAATSGSNGKARFTPPTPGWTCRPCAVMWIWVLTSRRAMAHSMPGPM